MDPSRRELRFHYYSALFYISPSARTAMALQQYKHLERLLIGWYQHSERLLSGNRDGVAVVSVIQVIQNGVAVVSVIQNTTDGYVSRFARPTQHVNIAQRPSYGAFDEADDEGGCKFSASFRGCRIYILDGISIIL